MKILATALVLTLAVTTSFSAMAEGSKVDKSTIINASKNKKVINAAIGNKSKASVGSVTIEGSKVSKSTIINASKNDKVINAAIGNKSTADTGSIRIE